MILPAKEWNAERAAALLEDGPLLLVWLDPDGRVERANQAFVQQTQWRLNELRGRDWCSSLLPESEQDRTRHFLRAVVRGEARSGFSHRLLTRAGVERELEWQYQLLHGDNGRPAGVLGIGMDVTERRQQERLASGGDGEQRLRGILDGLFAFVGVCDLEGRLVEVNRPPVELAGLRREDLIGQPFADTYWWSWSTSAQDTVRAAFAAAARGEVVRADLRGRLSEDRFIIVDTMIGPLRNSEGRITGIICSGVDVTDRHRAEQELKERERRLSAIYANVTGILFVVAVEPEDTFRFVSVNQAFLDATGLPRKAVVGRSVREIIPQPSLDMVLRNYREALRTRQTVRWEEVSVYPAGTKHGAVAVTPIPDADGAITQLIGIVHDITERKRAEEALREEDRRKTEFLAMLSHEIRNPLASILISSYVLEKAQPGGEQALQARAVIERQTEHLSRLVDDLLDITRISQGKIALRRERVELNRLVRTAVEDHRELFARQEVALAFVDADQPLYVDGDPTRLVQIIGNLLSNSAKFTSRGGRTTVILERASPDQAAIRVRDDGAGIAPEMLAHIFEPFVQASQALDRSAGGLGLGLALVKGLVDMHGGTVSAESVGPGMGSQFTVHLPLRIPVEPQAPVRPSPTNGAAARRVLVIEDNVDMAESLRTAVELTGHQVEVAYTGPAGLEKARALKPDLIICDIGLPELDGYDVARAIRADPELRSIWLIAMSGYAQPEDVQKAREAGFDRHLAKPASFGVLAKILAEATQATAER